MGRILFSISALLFSVLITIVALAVVQNTCTYEYIRTETISNTIFKKIIMRDIDIYRCVPKEREDLIKNA